MSGRHRQEERRKPTPYKRPDIQGRKTLACFLMHHLKRLVNLFRKSHSLKA